jgi:ABC-type multidrug transport system fused ATPase/permease subunit
LLSLRDRRGAVALVCLLLAAMVFETLGIGILVPALGIVTQPEMLERFPGGRDLVPVIKNADQRTLAFTVLGGLVAIYLLKSVFLAFVAWRQMRFAYRVQADISRRLFAGYLARPYAFHLRRNSAQLINNALGETQLFTHGVIISGVSLLAELFVLVGVSALLISMEPLAALGAAVLLGLLATVFYRSIRSHLARWGAIRQAHEGKRIQHLQQGLGSVKEVILLGRAQEFVDQYDVHNRGSARVVEYEKTLAQLPRLGLELFAVVGLAAVVVFLVMQGRSFADIVPRVALFAAASFRLIPSMNRMATAAHSLRFAKPVIQTIRQELEESPEPPARAREEAGDLPFQRALEVSDLSYTYPGAEHPVLSGVSFTVQHGQSVGLIGGSGAGKSTLVDLLLGLLEPTSGRIAVDGRDIREALRAWQTRIGYVPQHLSLIDDSLCRNVAFGVREDQIDRAAVARALKMARLDSFVAGLPQGIDTFIGERGARLSGGQRQRIGIARALYRNPQVLVLDEATSALDVDTEREVLETLRTLAGQMTMIIVTHRMNALAGCQHVFRVGEGAATLVPQNS